MIRFLSFLAYFNSMWNLLYQLASPKIFYRWTGIWIPWIAFFSILTLLLGWVGGLIFAPADYQQGDAFRIIYVHVPSAFLSMAIYAGMGFLALLLLIWRIKLAGMLLGLCAQWGACMAFLALVTGSIWGKPMWGTWWVWDARLTSELILLFLYAAILALANSGAVKEQADRLIAILTLIGLIDLPIIHYSVYWWNTLHQGSTLTLFSSPKIAPSMLYPLLMTLLGFILFSIWIILLKARHELLWRERRQRWVQTLIEGEFV